MKKQTKKNQKEILKILSELYNGTTSALHYNNAFELLIAVILSAQCTDERVNIITQRIFPKYKTPQELWAIGQDKIMELIKDCGLFRAKSGYIYQTCQIITERFAGQVPQTIDQLMILPGVGRKTANVVVSQMFNTPAIAVDTHVFRTSKRLGLATADTPLAVEEELMLVIPKNKWSEAHHWLIWHGRKICKARKPLCEECSLKSLCLIDNT